MTEKKPVVKLDTWSKRRKLIHASLITCGLFVTIGALNPMLDPSVANTLITQSFVVGGAVLMGYIGFATWEDKAKK